MSEGKAPTLPVLSDAATVSAQLGTVDDPTPSDEQQQPVDLEAQP